MITQATNLSTDINTRLHQVYNIAQVTWSDNQIMAQVCTAQAILESGLLQPDISGLAKKNNLFGIKGVGTSGQETMNTVEFVNGIHQVLKDGFAINNTIQDSFTQYYNLMQHDRYKDVISASTLKYATVALGNSGYATDPSYSAKVYQIAIMRVLPMDNTNE